MKKDWIVALLSVVCFGIGIMTADGGAQTAFIGAIVSAVAGIGSAVAGGIMSSNAQAKKERLERERAEMKRRYIERQLKEENEDYAAHINERAMYRYTSQYNANRLSEALREQLKDARGRQAVMGGTDEQIAEQMNNNAKAMSDYYGQVEMQNEAEKKQLEQAHKARKQQLDAAAVDAQDQYLAQQAENAAARSQNVASAVTSGINAIGQVAGSLSDANMKSSRVNVGTAGTQPMQQPPIGFRNFKVNVPQRMELDDSWTKANYYNVGGSKGFFDIPSKDEFYAKKLGLNHQS